MSCAQVSREDPAGESLPVRESLTRRPETRSIGTQTDDITVDNAPRCSNAKPTRKDTETQTDTGTGGHVSPKGALLKEPANQQVNPKVSSKGGSPGKLADRRGPSTAGGDKPSEKSSSRAERPPKGSQDATKCANQYASLEDLEMEGISGADHKNSSKPTRRDSGGDKPTEEVKTPLSYHSPR